MSLLKYLCKRLDRKIASIASRDLAMTKGFTLIEILVVIAIIGILATILIGNFNGVRVRSRDAQRKSDIRQLQAALELYRADQGVYPAAASGAIGACGAALKDTAGQITYMASIPCDSLGAGAGYNSGNYLYANPSGTSTYTLTACLENGNDTAPGSVDISSSTCPSKLGFQGKNP